MASLSSVFGKYNAAKLVRVFAQIFLPKFRFTAFYQRGKTGVTGGETQTKSQEERIVAYCNVTRIEDLAMVADNICHCTL